MWQKVLIAIILIVGIILCIGLVNNSKKNIKHKEDNIVESQTNLSTKYVTDDCIEEWEDYALSIQEELKEASGTLSDEKNIYILREKNNIINVYYMNDVGEEVLYKVTDISTKYLAKDDISNLEKGIKVEGIQNLNQLLEDFE